ncbi:MAG: 3-deoxy-manno-octulosonate cytidylyltransferase [bacterium]
MKFRVVIPARYESSRLPGKPLLDIHGKSMIKRVYECAVGAGAEQVLVATDDHRIFAHCLSQKIEAALTSRCHRSGTERICELAHKSPWEDDEIIVNLQGDEPMMPTDNIRQVAELLNSQPDAAVATLWEEAEQTEVSDPNCVKLTTDKNGFALYFSRAEIPFDRDKLAVSEVMQEQKPWRRHVGIYAYRASLLRNFQALELSSYEHIESLEQLRILYNGYRIVTAEAGHKTPAGIDTKKDYENLLNNFSEQS